MIHMPEEFVESVALTAILVEPIDGNDYYVEGSLYDIIEAWEAYK